MDLVAAHGMHVINIDADPRRYLSRPAQVVLVRAWLPEIGRRQPVLRQREIVEAVANRGSVRSKLRWRESRRSGNKEHRIFEVAPVFVQSDVLEDLVVIATVSSTNHLFAVPCEVVNKTEAWT